jgi:hypothetical protein
MGTPTATFGLPPHAALGSATYRRPKASPLDRIGRHAAREDHHVTFLLARGIGPSLSSRLKALDRRFRAGR